MISRRKEVRRLGDLEPHPLNAELFPYTREHGIDDLAESIEESGLLDDIHVEEDNRILHGERRWRAATQAHGSDHELEVVVVAGLKDDAARTKYILTQFGTMRKPRPSEQVRVYLALREIMKSEHGVASGQAASNDAGSLSGKEIKLIAARQAGLGSPKTADRAVKVFDSGIESVKRSLDEGNLSITQAWEYVTGKRAVKSSGRPSASQENSAATADPSTTVATGPHDSTNSRTSPSTARKQAAPCGPPEPKPPLSGQPVPVVDPTKPMAAPQVSPAPESDVGPMSFTEAPARAKNTRDSMGPDELLRVATESLERAADGVDQVSVLSAFARLRRVMGWRGLLDLPHFGRWDKVPDNLYELADCKRNAAGMAGRDTHFRSSLKWTLREGAGPAGYAAKSRVPVYHEDDLVPVTPHDEVRGAE